MASNQNALLSFFCCFPVTLWKSSMVSSWQSCLNCYSSASRSSLILLSMGAVQTYASTQWQSDLWM